ncbi:ral-GDS-related protein-like [Ailuropoda melanoleuca]|uniref:ral-GDS-related protein-like n=1 Tax=Ailuropoda melanoleuca TaxID=9646 RepID=UPI0014942A33|nr:ral-GDS-related protein-like [Ailuropoda melanoleuca]
MGESFQVRQSLCMDRPGWMKDLPEACPLPPQPAWTSWEEAIPDYRTWAGRRVSQPPWRIGHMSPALETVFLNVPHKAEQPSHKSATLVMDLQRAQKKRLQKKVAAKNYTLEPEDPFGVWFQAMEPLSEAASYTLTCQLEPQS